MEAPLDTGQVKLIDSVCRLCATQNERLIAIFGEEGLSNDLLNKINLYMPIKVSINDDLPLQCCWNCASTLLAWHELVLTCAEVDRKFKCSQILVQKPQNDEFDVTIDNSETQISQETENCDNTRAEVKIDHSSLHDFTDKKPKPEIPFLALQDQNHLVCDSYMSEIEQQFIDPDFVDSSEYKVNMEEPLSEEDKCELDEQEEDDKRPFFACHHCNAIFFSEKSIAKHMKDEHEEEYEEMEEKETEPKKVKKEKRKHTKIDQEMISAAKVVVDGRIYYHCKECGKNLHSPYTYTWHMRIHTGERPYVCDLCGKQFRVSQGLVRHLRETHEGIKKFPCDLCGRMFATRRNVEEHRRIHTNERPYVCDLCGKSFKQKASLFVHKRSHKNYFPFKCSYCNLGFRTKPPLLVHVTKHTGEKPYKCDVCGRCFRIKYELKRHRLIHSDEKPWVCNICGYRFRQKRYLRNHTKSNHAAVD